MTDMTGHTEVTPAQTGLASSRPVYFLLNQFIPPDPAPTARLAADIMEALPEIEWCPIGTDRAYRSPGSGFVQRLMREWKDLRTLGRSARCRARPEAIVALSSPPMLLLEAVQVGRSHGVPVHHWILDLYPDVAVALHQVPALVGRGLALPMRAALAACASVTAVDEAMAWRVEQRYGIRCGVCRPWPERIPDEPFPGWPGVPHDAPVWLYSGNLGQAHDWETLVEIQTLLEQRRTPWWLVVQGGGKGWEKARQAADQRGLRQCAFRPYATPGQLGGALAWARVGVATQREETAGMLWPSKVAALAERAQAVLWIGPRPEGATHPLLNRTDVGSFRPGEAEAAAAWLESIRNGSPAPAVLNRVGARDVGLAYWRQRLLP
ncbi:MAG: hypothetical protein OHK005_08040 [Candidatus Methylacidiphilales bacterium]